MIDREFKALRRDACYAAIPGKINAGILIGVVVFLCLCALSAVGILAQAFYEASMQGGH